MGRFVFGLAVVATLLAYNAGGAYAGPYDGAWTGAAVVGGARCPEFSITVTVTDTQFTGSSRARSTTGPVAGQIGPDGAVHGHVGPFQMTGEFSGDSFTGSFTGNATPAGPCNYAMTLSRS